MISPFSARLRTTNNQNHSRKQWMLGVKWNLMQKIIMIEVTHKNRLKMEVVNKINQTDKNEKNAIDVVQEHIC